VPNRKDIRYRLDLAGGATMDVGCYAVHQLRTVVGTEPTVESATAKLASPDVDRAMKARLSFPDGPAATMSCALLDAQAPVADLRIAGARGVVHAFFPTRPQIGWVTSRIDGRRARERVGGEATFWYQLRAFCDAVRRGTPVPTGPDDAIATMEAIDATYRAAGLPTRS
jgi:predicted dehydrogenase